MSGITRTSWDEAIETSGESTYTNDLDYRMALKLLPPSRRHLEIGCGTGKFMSLWKQLRKTPIEGTDYSPLMVRLSRKAGHTVKLGNSDKLPYPDGSFETASLIDVLEHIPRENRGKVVSEALRVVKRPGCLVVTIPNRNSFLTWLCNTFGNWEKLVFPYDEPLTYAEVRSLFGKTATVIPYYFPFPIQHLGGLVEPFARLWPNRFAVMFAVKIKKWEKA